MINLPSNLLLQGGSFDPNKQEDIKELNARLDSFRRKATGIHATAGLIGGGLIGGGLLNMEADQAAAMAGLGALIQGGIGYGLGTLDINMFKDQHGLRGPTDPKPSREKSASYIMGVYRAGVDAGILAPASFEKMAQQADIASAATQDEMMQVGASVTAQDISSLAKILSVLTQLQQMYQDQSMMMDPAMMQQQGMMMDPAMMQQQGMMMDPAMMQQQGMMMDPAMMQQQGMMMDPAMMQQQGMMQQGPMGPPPQGMMAPGPGPAVQ